MQKGVNFFNTTQFSLLLFFVPREKPHGVQGLIKHYHMILEPKLGHGTCEILQIPCACYACTYMLDNPWDPRINTPNKS